MLAFPYLKNRLSDIFLFGTLLSFVPVLILNYIVNTGVTIFVISILFNLGNLGVMIYHLCNYRLTIKGLGNYYMTNFLAVLIYGSLPLIANYLLLKFHNKIDFLLAEKLYKYVFYNFDIIKVVANIFGSKVSSTVSAIVYICFLFCLVLIMPIFINKRKRLNGKDSTMLIN